MQKYPKTWLTQLNSPYFRISPRVIFGAGFAISALCGSAVVVCNTVGLSISQSLLQAKRNGVPIVPSPRLRDLVDKVKIDFQLSKSQAASVDIFCSSLDSSDVFGSLGSSYGVLIGVPSFLVAESSDEVICDKRLDGSFSEGEEAIELAKFKESSLFSDNAKCYIIAEGLELSRNSDHFMIPAYTGFFGTGAALSFTAFYIRKFDLLRYGFIQRNALYLCTCFAFGLISLAFLNTVNNRYNFEKIVNRLSDNYINAGIEYYEKLLARYNFLSNCYLSIFERLDVNISINNATIKLETLKMKKEEVSQLAAKK